MNAQSKRSKVRQLILRDALVICWVCGQPIDRRAPENNPDRLSLDHVVPRRLGGGHELGNLQLAHAACNERRDREDRRAAARVLEAAVRPTWVDEEATFRVAVEVAKQVA
jgi:5-methylcytosine-specific restriction endonuclease McrA